ncbi:tyrosine-protein phosphatase non-receptor type 21-like [Pollicipes pollicipes]|uniref:tyrosine-protein phosphatase non-receptor type 21-like n=1 Tax=Pollicipes pollicipes TaxID=41117 RepID=UPI0018857756|nr:tyrosine-protein phosphatase non-receptor type 21-like [Pollicipes pollicipes]
MCDLTLTRAACCVADPSECQAIEARISNAGFFREFESVVKKRDSAEYTTARRPENENKNRFRTCCRTRQRVRVTAPPETNPTGYINASHISVTMGSQQRFYIAAQGPLPTTVLHFWQAVWENNVHLVVMLTDATLHRLGRPTACPEDAAGFVQFVDELATLRQTAASEMAVAHGGSRNTPVLVHCSAGVGRTGVTVMCDVLLHCLDHNLEVDVPKLLHHLRQQRMLMVQTMTQYKFIYQVLVHYLKRSRLI